MISVHRNEEVERVPYNFIVELTFLRYAPLEEALYYQAEMYTIIDSSPEGSELRSLAPSEMVMNQGEEVWRWMVRFDQHMFSSHVHNVATGNHDLVIPFHVCYQACNNHGDTSKIHPVSVSMGALPYPEWAKATKDMVLGIASGNPTPEVMDILGIDSDNPDRAEMLRALGVFLTETDDANITALMSSLAIGACNMEQMQKDGFPPLVNVNYVTLAREWELGQPTLPAHSAFGEALIPVTKQHTLDIDEAFDLPGTSVEIRALDDKLDEYMRRVDALSIEEWEQVPGMMQRYTNAHALHEIIPTLIVRGLVNNMLAEMERRNGGGRFPAPGDGRVITAALYFSSDVRNHIFTARSTDPEVVADYMVNEFIRSRQLQSDSFYERHLSDADEVLGAVSTQDQDDELTHYANMTEALQSVTAHIREFAIEKVEELLYGANTEEDDDNLRDLLGDLNF